MAAWQNQKLTVYHGTHDGALTNVAISIARCRPATDFGQGFYTTTHLHQAKEWANEKVRSMAARGKSASAAVYRFELDRNDLACLDDLAFVRAIRDFWSFVTACRHGAADHGRKAASAANGRPIYDVVIGPVTLWPQRLTLGDCDQISFHTNDAIKLLQPSLHIQAGPMKPLGKDRHGNAH